MSKGYRYSTVIAGLMLMAGFLLPWLGKDPFHFSGISAAMLGNSYLAVLPLSGAMAVFLAATRNRLRPGHLLYPGMAALLTLVLLVSVISFADTGALLARWSADANEIIRLKIGDNLILFDPITDMEVGLVLTLAGIVMLFLIPASFHKDFEETRETDPKSYRSIIRENSLPAEYSRFWLTFTAISVLVITYVWCGISPLKLWENRGNAKEYLFGRELSQDDITYINTQRERAPQIEAAGRAEEYMSNKYRGVPFSNQPSAQEKAAERKAMTQKFLAGMTEKEKDLLEIAVEKRARKEKKGGYFPPETSGVKIKGYLVALMETIAIAVWGTLLALVCAVPVSFFAAKNTLALIISNDDVKSKSLRSGISFGVRRFLDACRGFNEFVMALIFVAVIGLGPYAGILALWIHTFGILGKVFSEQIEAIESGQVEALTSTGASAAQTIAFSVMPQVLPGLVSYTLLRFESNVRSAAILGFVGAGGIGFLIFDKLNGYLFREVCTMMIIIIMTVGIIDHLCSKIRMKFI